MAAGRNIKGITVEIGGDTTGLDKALKDVNRSLTDTQAQLKDVDRLLKLDPGNTELIAQKQRLLGKEIEETKKKLNDLKTANDQVAGSVKNYDAWKAKFDPIKKELDETKKKSAELKDEMKKLEEAGKVDTDEYKKLQTELDATKEKAKDLKEQAEAVNDEFGNPISQDQYDALQREIVETENNLEDLEKQAEESRQKLINLAEVGEKMKTLGENISKAGKNLTKYITTPIVGLATAAVKTTADFDSSMSQVAAVSGATGDDFEALRNKAREMGAQTKFSASEAAEAMNYMAMAGWKTEDMLNGIEGIMSLAAASGEELGTTSDIVTDALTAFGLSAADSGHFADVLAAASSNANTNVSMMGETFKYAAPVAGALGFSVEDVAEAIGLMANSGIKASQAGTALRGILTSLGGEITLTGKELGEVTIQTTNADGSMRELGDILGDLRSAFSQLTESEASSAAEALVGKNAMSGFLALMNAAPADIEKLNSAIANCDGTAENMAATMQDNLSGQVTILKSQLQELAISFGDILVPKISALVTKIQELVDKWNNMDEGTRKVILVVAGAVAAIGPLLVVFGKMATGVGSILMLFGKASGTFGGFGKAAASAAAPAANAAKGVSSLSQSATGLLAVGAGIALAAAGFALLAQSAIALAEAGWPAIAVMGGMVAAIAGLAVGAAAIAPALTAGAAGLVAFGAAITLIGVGILAATSGVALLATQLPTIAEYGSAAASALGELGIALATFGAGALVAGAGLTAVAGGLTLVAVGAVAAALGVATLGAGVAVLAVGVAALAVGMLALGAALTVCGAGLAIIAATASTAAVGMAALALSATAAFIPIAAGALSIAALDLALVSLLIPLGAVTLEFGASAAACGLLALALDACAVSVKDIAATASEAGQSLNEMVTAVDVVQTGLDGLKTIATNAVSSFIEVFTAATPNATAVALALATGITTSVQTGLAPIMPNATLTMTTLNEIVMAGMTLMGTNILAFITTQMELLTSTSSAVVLTVSDGMGSCVSIISSACTSIAGYLSSLAENAYQWGADMMQGMINGIYSKMAELRAAAAEAASVVSANLHFSRPDEGPLRDYEEWMPDMMRGLANGIEKSRSMVQSAIKNVAGDMIISPKMGALELATATAKASSGTMNHSGKIRVEGVSDSGTLSGVVDIIIDQLRREVRM